MAGGWCNANFTTLPVDNPDGDGCGRVAFGFKRYRFQWRPIRENLLVFRIKRQHCTSFD
jgi:hypothetical protein